MRLIYLLLLSITASYGVDVTKKVEQKPNGDTNTSDRVDLIDYTSVRKVAQDSSGVIKMEVVFISSPYAEISMMESSLVIAKTKGEYDVGYSFNKNGKLSSVIIIDKKITKPIAGYILQNEAYVPINEEELKRIGEIGNLFDDF
jgi:hypothetical protein